MQTLLVVDVQNGFINGNLAVANAGNIIPLINELITRFDSVVLTQDYHPVDHISFYQNHAGATQFDIIQLPYGEQVLWNAHCVQGTKDAEFHTDLNTTTAKLIIQKGCRTQVDSYSAFIEADGTPTGLADYLHECGTTGVYVVGIATDFCVAWTAMDAVKCGFDCTVITDATVAIDIAGSLTKALGDMSICGVVLTTSDKIKNLLKS